ncbi:hypothetical protein ON010_g16564 [Phytophthora cinnamomi]|nr:hypothetical protein ON010_g16564 [Phytophthora cinnamomi]
MVELLSSRKQKDLADTREQISSCFEKVACFLLPHPGHAVTEREYDGSVEAIDNRFLELLTAYLDDLFDPANLFPKKIHGVTVTSRELFTYIKTYAGLFREASIFPEAKTLLEATAEANNVNQRDKAMLKYKREMEKVAGSKCQYVPVQALEAHHKACLQGAMDVFDDGARMGRRSEILRFRQELADEIEKERHRYLEINAERDPYKNLEFYLIPGCLALSLLVFRISQDLLCYDHIGYDIPLYDCNEPHAVASVLGAYRVHAADHDVHRPGDVQAREDRDLHCKNRHRRLQGRWQGEERLGCSILPPKAPQ